jgi:hypothetical protein
MFKKKKVRIPATYGESLVQNVHRDIHRELIIEDYKFKVEADKIIFVIIRESDFNKRRLTRIVQSVLDRKMYKHLFDLDIWERDYGYSIRIYDGYNTYKLVKDDILFIQEEIGKCQ